MKSSILGVVKGLRGREWSVRAPFALLFTKLHFLRCDLHSSKLTAPNLYDHVREEDFARVQCKGKAFRTLCCEHSRCHETDGHKARQRHNRRSKERFYEDFPIGAAIPDSFCESCKASYREKEEDLFDIHGYPFEKVLRVSAGPKWRQLPPEPESHRHGVFRFLDLPPELRNRIYDLLFTSAQQPVCIWDSLLGPSKDLPSVIFVNRVCTDNIICVPCRLHNLLGTSMCGLSRVSRQLHSETATVPYMVNTFSLHNLYYLQAFLHVIGLNGRKRLKSLKFNWRFPEEEAIPLNIYTAAGTIWRLLVECVALDRLDVQMDVLNVLTWQGNGTTRAEPLGSFDEMPHVQTLCKLRDLKEVRFAWEHCDGLEGMPDFVRYLIAIWRSKAKGTDANFTPIEAEVHEAVDNSRLRYIHWKAGGETVGTRVTGQDSNAASDSSNLPLTSVVASASSGEEREGKLNGQDEGYTSPLVSGTEVNSGAASDDSALPPSSVLASTSNGVAEKETGKRTGQRKATHIFFS